MDWKGFIATIIGILAVTGFLVFIVFAMFNEADQNRDKDIEMTGICVEAGYSGWDNYYGCIGGPGAED